MNDQVPVRWDEKLAGYGKEVAALERPSLAQISLRAGVMKYQDQIVPGNKLDCLIIASVFENRWYPNKFDPNKRENPGCFALSVNGKDMTPHDTSPQLQSDACETCPQFQWGSAPDGGRGKACKQVRRLALLPATILKDTDVDKIATAEMALMSVPVTSGKNWANYVNNLSNEYHRPPWAVLSTVYVEPDPRTQFQVKFKYLGFVSDEYLEAVEKRYLSATDVLMTPYDFSGSDAEQAPAAKADKTGKKY